MYFIKKTNQSNNIKFYLAALTLYSENVIFFNFVICIYVYMYICNMYICIFDNYSDIVSKRISRTRIQPFFLIFFVSWWENRGYLTYSMVLKFNCRKYWCRSCGKRFRQHVACEIWSRISPTAKSFVPLSFMLLFWVFLWDRVTVFVNATMEGYWCEIGKSFAFMFRRSNIGLWFNVNLRIIEIYIVLW